MAEADNKDIQDNKVLAAISYLPAISIIVLLVKKDSKFVKFHAKQGLVLFIALIIFSFIPVLGYLLDVVVVIFVIVGLLKALAGECWKMPLVSLLAEKINL